MSDEHGELITVYYTVKDLEQSFDLWFERQKQRLAVMRETDDTNYTEDDLLFLQVENEHELFRFTEWLFIVRGAKE